MIKINDNNQLVMENPKLMYRGSGKEYVVFDTETSNDDKIIFDFSMIRVDSYTGKELERINFVIIDSYKTKKIIMGKYSKEKRKKYPPLIKSGEYVFIERKDLIKFLNDYCKKHKKVCAFGAFNIQFDLQALFNTFTYTNPHMKYFKKPLINELSDLKIFEYDVFDIWANAVVIFGSKEYKDWYKENNFPLTKNGYMHTNVQYLKKFLAYKGLYKEKHVANEDTKDENNLMLVIAIMRYDRKIILNVSGMRMLPMAKLVNVPKKSKLYKDYVLFQKFIKTKRGKRVDYQV